MGKNILVTGGCGFIGSEFIKYQLIKTNNKILNIDCLTYAGNELSLKGYRRDKNYSFENINICDEIDVEDTLKKFKPEVIVNFAAETHVDNAIKNSRNFLRTNIWGTSNLLNFCRVYPVKLFLQISTDEVYGSLKERDPSKKETDILNPKNPYSASKASAEHLCLSYMNTYDIPVIITRSSNNYGHHQYPEKFLPVMITKILKNEKVPIYAEGKNIRDWLYVDDNTRAISLVMDKGIVGEIYNISADNELRNIDVCNRVLKMMGVKPKDYIEFVEDRLGHDWRYSLDSTKIKKLGWEVKKDFTEGLEKTINWYKNSRWFWNGKKTII